jgi:hypothetical protein
VWGDFGKWGRLVGGVCFKEIWTIKSGFLLNKNQHLTLINRCIYQGFIFLLMYNLIIKNRMQKSILITFLMAFTSILFGQSKPNKIENVGDRRTELYYYSTTNYDSIRFTIQGKNDTVLTETFFRNGRIEKQIWKQDSTYKFTNQGFIDFKEFGDSVVSFYKNVYIKNRKITRENELILDINYDENGKVAKKTEQKRIGKSSWYNVVSDSLGNLYSGLFDTIIMDKTKQIWQYDTFYHRNGKPIYIGIKNDKDNYLTQNFYDNKGVLIESITPFSNQLIPFKDNVDCYYGFKNSRGDTIISPRFDRYKQIGYNFFAVYEGFKCRLMHLDGTFISTPIMEDIEVLKEENLLSNIENDFDWRKQINNISLHDIFDQSVQIIFVNFPEINAYFSYSVGKKYGIIDRKGNSVMPLQYYPVKEYLNNGEFFYYQFDSESPSEPHKTGYLRRDGTPLFPLFDNSYMRDVDGYVSITQEIKDTTSMYKIYPRGLLDKNGDVLLEPKFGEIEQKQESNLFMVTLRDNIGNREKAGVFDAENRRWLVDTTDFSINSGFREQNHTIFFSKKTKKYGAFNQKGDIVLPLIYEDLDLVNDASGFFIAKKGKKYSFLSLNNHKKRTEYDYLKSIYFDIKLDNDETETPLFFAQSNGKWGIIDSNDRILYPFTADYMAIESATINHLETIIIVENQKVSVFDANSFPRKNSLTSLFKHEKILFNTHVLGSFVKSFFFNLNGDVIIPPQYRVLNSIYRIDNDDENVVYYHIENAEKQRKIVFAKTGKIIDFPFNYEVKYASPESKIIIVADEKLKPFEQKFGVVTIDGKELISPTNYGIGFNPYNNVKDGVYFVRRDTPKEDNKLDKRTNTMDTLTDVDNQWFMYDTKGQLLNKKPFRFPFNFNGELGLGMQDDTFNLFRKDGSIFSDNYQNQAPPQYRNMRRDEKTGFYYCFQNQGLTTTISINKGDGQTLLESGRYDGAGVFYGKYALVSLAGKIGLIDSFGREIIAPQDLHLLNTENLIDSLAFQSSILQTLIDSIEDKNSAEIYLMRSKLQDFPIKMDYSSDYENDPDSLNLSPKLRNSVWHLLLENKLKDAVWRVGDFNFDHAIIYSKSQQTYHNLKDYSEFRLNRLLASDKTIAFCFKMEQRPIYTFHNYYFKNNRWNDLQINNLLQIQGEKRWQFNELLTRKVKALKDEEIDCSNASAFIAQVENRFMLTKDGIDFCFDSKKENSQFAIISFSWAELEGYLKMRL